MKKNFPKIAYLIFSVLIIALTACKSKNIELSEASGWMLNTYCSITIYQGGAEDEANGALELARYYEGVLSANEEGSDIAVINAANAAKEPASVSGISSETISIIERADEYAKMTGGLFDIRLGALSRLWDFNGEGHVPTEDELKAALDTPQIDLGGIAKGYIADRIAEYLIDAGINTALINLGGNISVIGSSPKNELWNIGIEKPQTPDAGTMLNERDVAGIIRISSGSVVTSGTYERCFYDEAGNVYHHILDPNTGYPAETDVVSVTVAGPCSMDCDALSTSCLLLGGEGALALIEGLDGYEAVIILEDGSILTSSGADFLPH